MMNDIMTFDDVFDEHAELARSAGKGDRFMPKVLGDLPKAELDELYANFLYTAIMQSYLYQPDGVKFKHEELRDIGQRLKKWPAMRTYIFGFQDARWDVSSQLPQTDALYSDSMLPEIADDLGQMFLGHNHMIHPINPEAVAGHAQALESNSTGVALSHAITLIIISMGSRYGLEVTDPSGKEVLMTHQAVSEKERLRIDPRSGSIAMALFEDAQLRGGSTPTQPDVAHFFEGVEHIVQFEDTMTVMQTLGLLSQMSPELQRFSLKLYKQYRGMLFSDKAIKTTSAVQKITEILGAYIEDDTHLSEREHVVHAYMALTDRILLAGNIARLEQTALDRINTGWYQDFVDK